MRTIIPRAAGALGLAAVGLVAASAATAHADTGGISFTFGPVTYSCNPVHEHQCQNHYYDHERRADPDV